MLGVQGGGLAGGIPSPGVPSASPSSGWEAPPLGSPSPGAPVAGAGRRPFTDAERQLLLTFFARRRAGTLAVAVVALVFAILFYAQPGFVLMILTVALVAATPGLASQTARMRKAIAGGVVTDLQGIPAKLGARGTGTYGLQFGTEVIAVPLPVYDRFGPNAPGTLTLLDRANLVLAVNGQPLPKPARAGRSTLGALAGGR